MEGVQKTCRSVNRGILDFALLCPYSTCMKYISWSPEKAFLLRSDVLRNGVGFEECLAAIDPGRVLDDLPNPSPQSPHQRMLILNIENYAYAVPYVESEGHAFLKTVFPSRKYTAKYLRV